MTYDMHQLPPQESIRGGGFCGLMNGFPDEWLRESGYEHMR